MKLEIQYLNPNLLHPNKFNPNRQTPEEEEKLMNSVERFDFFKPIIVRQLDDGKLEILGGEHRWKVAVKKKIAEVPVVNLGTIDDKTAKEICITDNQRMGHDDNIALAEVLGDLDIDELLKFTSYSEQDIAGIFSSVEIDLGDLGLDEEDDKEEIQLPATRVAQTSVFQRYKVPIGDAEMIEKVIETIMKREGFTDEDSLSNAGHALAYLCQRFKHEG